MSTDTGKHYHNQCTGLALETVKKHQVPEDITLFGSCFCPFVQRVWVALEFLGIPYKMTCGLTTNFTDEVDPYRKPQDLLQVSPKGLVPALKLHKHDPPRALNESTVIMEYIEDLASTKTGRSLLPSLIDPYARALVRLQADHTNRHLVPSFYRFLQSQSPASQIESAIELHTTIATLISLFERMEHEVLSGAGYLGEGEAEAVRTGLGLWVDGGQLGWADVMAGPWLFRASNVLKHYRGFELPSEPKAEAYFKRLFGHPAFKATCSSEELYIDSYERYAFNRPNTSQVANAINAGRSLP